MRVSHRNGAVRLRLPRRVKRLMLKSMCGRSLSPSELRDLIRYRVKVTREEIGS